jgi:methionyl-tRNA formyltransferase
MVDGARVKVLAATAAPGIRMPAGQFGYSDGRVLVGTGSDALELLAVQPAGKNPMPAADWWRGRRTTATIDGTM